MFIKKLTAALLLTMFTSSCVGTDFILDPVQLFEPKIETEPGNSAILKGENIHFTATYYDSLGQEVQSTVFQWTSLNSDIAVIDAEGRATGIMPGQAQILARANNIVSEPALLSILNDPNQVGTVIVAPDSAKGSPGQTIQFSAMVLNLNGETIAGKEVAWRSGNPETVSVDTNGLATALKPGIAEIIATVDSIDSRPAIFEVLGQLKSGQFVPRPGSSYTVRGGVTMEKEDNNNLLLQFGDNFVSSSGPGLYVYLSTTNSVGSNSLEVEKLKSTQGQQHYTIQGNIDLDAYSWVIIHCKPFNVTFGYAELK